MLLSTHRYMTIKAENLRLEIRFIWYAKSYQRTRVNTICKLLLVQFFFEKLSAIAAKFRTHWFNYALRKVIARIRAKQDTVVFSIIKSEWPTVKKSLLYQINK